MEGDRPDGLRRSLLSSAVVVPLGLQIGSLCDATAPNQSAPIDVRAFGAKGDGISDDTDAIQRALNAAAAGTRKVSLAHGTYLTRGNSVDITGGNVLAHFRVSGAGKRATRLMKIGTSDAPVLAFSVPDLPTEANLLVHDLSIDGGGLASDGLRLTGIASSTLLRVIVENCGRALNGSGALGLLADNCSFNRSEIGAFLRKSGAAHANAITFRDCQINLNSEFGIDFGQGSLLRLRDCQVEANGRAGNSASGGLVVRSEVDQEFDYALVVVDGCWFELNRGWSIQVEGADGLLISLRDTQILSSERGRALLVRGGMQVNLDQVMAPSPGDTLEIHAARLNMTGGVVYQLLGKRGTDDIRNVAFGRL